MATPLAACPSAHPVPRIPCFNGSPITKTKILGGEVWVLLLEKAVARMVVGAAVCSRPRKVQSLLAQAPCR